MGLKYVFYQHYVPNGTLQHHIPNGTLVIFCQQHVPKGQRYDYTGMAGNENPFR